MKPALAVLILLWALVCTLTAGLVTVGLKAYGRTGDRKLRVATAGFACFAFAAGSSSLLVAVDATTVLRLLRTTAFAAGFCLLYVSLYRD